MARLVFIGSIQSMLSVWVPPSKPSTHAFDLSPSPVWELLHCWAFLKLGAFPGGVLLAPFTV